MTLTRQHTNKEEPKSSGGYKLYGAQGVEVCARWRTFENFLEDMGERPEGTSIDRIDPSGNYEPGNCRWATQAVQHANRRLDQSRRERIPEIERMWAEGLTMKQIAAELGGISANSLRIEIGRLRAEGLARLPYRAARLLSTR